MGMAMKALLSTGLIMARKSVLQQREQNGGRLVNIDCALRECLVWTKISRLPILVALEETGNVFFLAMLRRVSLQIEKYLLFIGIVKYQVLSNEIIKLINPTLNFVPGAGVKRSC